MSDALARPSVYRIAQAGSDDRRRARMSTLMLQRQAYELQDWKPWEHYSWKESDPEPTWLAVPRPRHIVTVPKDQDFGIRKWIVLLTGNVVTKANQAVGALFNPSTARSGQLDGFRDYAAMFELFRPPAYASAHWQSDLDFGMQRINGCNPMVLQRVTDGGQLDPAFATAAGAWLREIEPGQTFSAALEQGRIFKVDYSDATLIVKHVPADVSMCAPTALFYATRGGDLLPLAIRLWPHGYLGADTKNTEPIPNEVITPLTGRWSWAAAKAHFQSVDGGYHEAVTHLMETHLILELTVVCAYRSMHIDHPVMQLLMPHFVDNLRLNALARDTLLRKGGDIDAAIGVGAKGAIDLIGAVWGGWDFWDKDPRRDLARRGLDDRTILPKCWYREDAHEILDATDILLRSLVHSWYASDAELHDDFEVQSFAAMLSDPVATEDEATALSPLERRALARMRRDDPDAKHGQIKGFPRAFETREQLALTLSQLLFRASAQHAAVNNGQYDRYGWPLYAPTTVNTLYASEGVVDDRFMRGEPLTEHDYWRYLPNRGRSLGQVNMARVLSAPTYTSVVRTGDSMAFDPSVHPAAAHAVQVYRERLSAISGAIRRRNTDLAAPYTYLDPYNISRSIEI